MAAIPLSRRALRLQQLGGADEAATASAPQAVRAAAIAALERGETHYTDRPGILPLRQRVSTWLETACGVASDPGRDVVITCGATEARFVAIQQLLEPGQSLLCLGDRSRIEGALVVRGCELVAADPEPTEQQLAGVAALYLSADSATGAARQRWLRQAAERGWWVIFELPAGSSAEHPAADPELRARTVSVGDIGADAGMASWRVGFVVAPSEPAPGLRNFKQALTICTTNLSQWGALALFEERA